MTNSRQPLSPYGPATYEQFKLSPAQRKKLLDLLEAQGVQLIDPRKFGEDVEYALRFYLTSKRQEEEASVKAIRAKLRTLRGRAVRLAKDLQALDQTTRHLIRQHNDGSNLEREILLVANALNHTEREVGRQHGGKGRTRARAREQFVALMYHTGRELPIPTSTSHGGVFEEFLKEIFNLIGERYDDVYALMLRARRYRVQSSEGAIWVEEKDV